MKILSLLPRLRTIPVLCGVLSAVFSAAPAAHAQTTTAAVTVLHRFTGGTDGALPDSPLIQGSDGNFYGTTTNGGLTSANSTGNGTFFRLTPDGTLTTLHPFASDASEGAFPNGKLVQDTDGNFYGTTIQGAPGQVPGGTVYKITATGVLTKLHTFTGEGQVNGGLVKGPAGNFFGVTQDGGTHGLGSVFQITPDGTTTTLHSFNRDDGAFPYAALTLGTDGNLYGTTYQGGLNDDGTIFKITPGGVLTVLHSFSGSDGRSPRDELVQAGDGNFYGTTNGGGTNDKGTLFKMTPDGTLFTLYRFTGGSDGSGPDAGLVLAADGSFYGTTLLGGTDNKGAIYRLSPEGTVTTLYSFPLGINRDAADGASPDTRLTLGSDGKLYGSASVGGTRSSGFSTGAGVLFAVTLGTSLHPPFFAGEQVLSSGVYYLQFSSGNPFGYYSYLADPHYIYHFDLGYEYVFDAADGNSGVYLYDFKSDGFLYTSPTFPFPYLYDFTLNTVLYYYPDANNPGRYNTDGYRFFYRFDTGQIIVK